MSTVANGWNPSATEARAWAYARDLTEPCQDWDLSLSAARHEATYLEIVADNSCRKRKYFLAVLYLIVGDAVRSKFATIDEPIIRGFLDRSRQYDHPDITVWRERSLALLNDPSSFRYDLWCGGGYAKQAT